MPDFDPNAFLAETSNPAFDPDQFLASTGQEDEKSKLMKRVGPPTMGDEAIMKDIPALTGAGYAASEVPVLGPLVKGAIGKVSPKTEEELDLGKARYEQENPKTATALQFAAPLALPLGPAKLGAQAVYQGATQAADSLLRGNSLMTAGDEGVLTTGGSMLMGRAGGKVAPYLRKAGDVVDKIPGKVADYLRKKAANNAADAALSGQTKLNRELSESARRNVGEQMLDAKTLDRRIYDPNNFPVLAPIMKTLIPETLPRSILGQSPKNLAKETAAASSAANNEIKNLIDELTAEGIQPSKANLLAKIQKLRDSKRVNQDTAAYHSYLENEANDLAKIPDEEFNLRFLQDRKGDVPYDKLAESTVKKVRKKFSGALQEAQDETIEGTGKKDVYKAMQQRSAGLIDAAKGAKERATRSGANRFLSPSDMWVAGIGSGVGGLGGLASGGDLESTLSGAGSGLAAGGANRFLRTRGSSVLAANLNTLSKMARTKFGPRLEAAAQRGKGALSVTHNLLYRNNPEYRSLYDSDQQDFEDFPITNANDNSNLREGH